MACDIEHDPEEWIDDDVAEAAQVFAAKCDEVLPDEDFEIKIKAEDLQGWVAYLYGHSGYGREIVGMMGRGVYHWEDTYYLSDEDVEILNDLVVEFAESISPDGTSYNLCS